MFNLNGEDGPIVGDAFATLVFYEKKKLSLALFYLRALTCRGKKMADVATTEIVHSSVIMCHGQLMSVEEVPVPQLHAWNGMLVQKVLKFRGENCRFVRLRANEDHMWFESSCTPLPSTQLLSGVTGRVGEKSIYIRPSPGRGCGCLQPPLQW